MAKHLCMDSFVSGMVYIDYGFEFPMSWFLVSCRYSLLFVAYKKERIPLLFVGV